jgi:L-ascorbate metabolism protein UlaG (beta-lactamase superfamily)
MTDKEVIAAVRSDEDAHILTPEEQKYFWRSYDIPRDTFHGQNLFLRNEALARTSAKLSSS